MTAVVLSLFGFQVVPSVVVLGVIIGMTYGLLAIGLVLIYRSNRIINFAHGEIGALGASALGLAVVRWHLPYWVAFVGALLLSGGVGAVAEVAVVRRLRRAPRLMSVVATVGFAQFLLLVSLAANSQVRAGYLFPKPPFFPEFDVGALRFTRAHSAMLLLTPILMAGLVLFFRQSRYGLAMRAAASNRDGARLSGIMAARMSTLSWGIAGAVSAFTAVLILSAGGFSTTEALGPALLLRALVAAVIGRMVSLPIAFAAGVVVGVVEQVTLWNYPQGGFVELLLLVVVLLVLSVQARPESRDPEKGSWAAVQAWPPLPGALRSRWWIRNLGRLVVGIGVAIALAIPALSTNRTAIVFVSIMAFTLIGLSIGIVTGLLGELSLGQFALAGVGATASWHITFRTGNYLLGFVGAGIAAALVSVLIGIPALRIRGLMLAVTTLSFALVAQSWLLQQSWALGHGVNPGRPIIGRFALDTGRRYYVFCLAVLILGFWLSHNLRRGGIGRALVALRDNEAGARAFTVPATLRKLQAFMAAGFLAGLGGALYGHALARISFDTFSPQRSVDLVAMTVIGGISILAGPLLGALYIIGVPAFVPLDAVGLAASALGWLVLILYCPGGLAQLARPMRDLLVRWMAKKSELPWIEPGAQPKIGLDLPAAPMGPHLVPDRMSRREKAPSGPILEAKGLSKHFGGITAVDDVVLEVAPGETLGIIGPNGAGKTTLFDLLSGFVRPDSGQIVFKGQNVSTLRPEERGRLGIIRSFQDAELFETMTVLDTVRLAHERIAPTRLAAAVAGLAGPERSKDRRARELIHLMGLDRYRELAVGQLSTGTRRITELTCLLALEPMLLLLDEPSAGIAQRETEVLGELLERVKRQLDATFVIIEHNMPLVFGLADRVVAMEAGRVIADGTPQAVRNHPQVVRSYLGSEATVPSKD